MLDKFLDLLFKYKQLFKLFVHIDYFVRYRRFLKSLELTNNREYIIRTNPWDKSKVAFYKKSFGNYEIIKMF